MASELHSISCQVSLAHQGRQTRRDEKSLQLLGWCTRRYHHHHRWLVWVDWCAQPSTPQASQRRCTLLFVQESVACVLVQKLQVVEQAVVDLVHREMWEKMSAASLEPSKTLPDATRKQDFCLLHDHGMSWG